MNGSTQQKRQRSQNYFLRGQTIRTKKRSKINSSRIPQYVVMASDLLWLHIDLCDIMEYTELFRKYIHYTERRIYDYTLHNWLSEM